MPTYRAVRSPLVSMGPSLQEERRRRRTVAHRLLLVCAVGVSTLLVALSVAWLGREVIIGSPARDAGASRLPPQQIGRPEPLTLATVAADASATVEQPEMKLQLPVNEAGITGIGYDHRPDHAELLELRPQGARANLTSGERLLRRFLATRQPSRLRWLSLSDGPPNAVTVGALPGTQVYAPITGTVIAIANYVIDGISTGKVIQLQPLGDGETIVVLRNLDAALSLAVGQNVSEGSTLIGSVRSMGDVLDQPLARYTHDAGDGVEIYVRRISPGEQAAQ